MSTSLPYPRVLLGPGPSSVSPRVLDALGRAPIGHLDPEIFELLERMRADLRTVFGTENAFTIPLTGTGMAGMESCLVNLIEPGDNVIIGVNGFFGGRMVEISRRLGANVTTVEAEWGDILEPEAIAEVFGRVSKVKLFACVHAETSTGVRQPLEALARITHEHKALFLVDAVTSLGGIPVEIDKVGVDACYSGTQKCLGAPPGLSPITASETALDAVTRRKTPVPNWYYDWSLLRQYYDAPHAYHHTVPVNLYYALGAALSEILAEGLEARWERHRQVSALLIGGLAEMGISPFAREGHRLPTLNAVRIPEGAGEDAAVRKRLLTDYGIEIGGGLGAVKGRIWRIGTMGESASRRNVTLLIAALKEVMNG